MKNLPESLPQKFSDNYESRFFVVYCYVIFMGKRVLRHTLNERKKTLKMKKIIEFNKNFYKLSLS